MLVKVWCWTGSCALLLPPLPNTLCVKQTQALHPAQLHARLIFLETDGALSRLPVSVHTVLLRGNTLHHTAWSEAYCTRSGAFCGSTVGRCRSHRWRGGRTGSHSCCNALFHVLLATGFPWRHLFATDGTLILLRHLTSRRRRRWRGP